MARHAIDCGADAVVGCHSHTIQSYEQYRGRWIFYGLGNYLFKAGYAQAVRENGLVEKIPIRLDPSNHESLLVSFEIVPDNGNGRLSLNRIQPMSFSEGLELRSIDKLELTFDLDAANARLNTYVKKNKKFARSLFVVKDIKKGEMITKENIRSIRPGYGLHPKYLNDILGKSVNQYLERGNPLELKNINT